MAMVTPDRQGYAQMLPGANDRVLMEKGLGLIETTIASLCAPLRAARVTHV